MRKVVRYCLAHPCWSGVSGIVAIVSAVIAVKLPVFASEPALPSPARIEVPDLSGKWEIESEISTSTLRSYVGLKIYYEAGISQTGSAIQVAGEKDSEQKPGSIRVIYEHKGRTPISGDGKVAMSKDGTATIELKATEDGLRRQDIETIFVLAPRKDGSLSGTFRSEAAATTGKCIWRRRE